MLGGTVIIEDGGGGGGAKAAKMTVVVGVKKVQARATSTSTVERLSRFIDSGLSVRTICAVV